jgi:hypothetical protein
MNAELVEINGGAGILFRRAGARDRHRHLPAVDSDADGRIAAIPNVADPGKLRAVADGTAHDLRAEWVPAPPAAGSARCPHGGLRRDGRGLCGLRGAVLRAPARVAAGEVVMTKVCVRS